MITNLAFSLIFVVLASLVGAFAVREHRRVLAERRNLLDEAAKLLSLARVTGGSDHFPILIGKLDDGRSIRMELVADTMVCRRLPQLWLKFTLIEEAICERPKIGVLARPTGAEFYSLVHDMPAWFTPPAANSALLMRGDASASKKQVERAAAIFGNLFSDPTLKEAAITPRGVRLVRQVAQGDRRAHLVLRQTRFPVTTIRPEIIKRTIAEAVALSSCLSETEASLPRQHEERFQPA